jgi:hypothetical protein
MDRRGKANIRIYVIFRCKNGGTQLRYYATRRKVAGSSPDVVIRFVQLNQSFQPQYGPVVDTVSNRNEYQEFS